MVTHCRKAKAEDFGTIWTVDDLSMSWYDSYVTIGCPCELHREAWSATMINTMGPTGHGDRGLFEKADCTTR